MMPHSERKMPLRWMFQHNNDPKHSSKLVKEWLAANEVQTLDWPPQSPVLNLIENLFGILKCRVAGRAFTSTQALKEALETEWKNIPMETINHLVESMPRRCHEVIKANGFSTKY